MLTGDVPSPVNPPEGCRFAGRCNKCKDVCKKVEPKMLEVAPGSFVACHLYN